MASNQDYDFSNLSLDNALDSKPPQKASGGEYDFSFLGDKPATEAPKPVKQAAPASKPSGNVDQFVRDVEPAARRVAERLNVPVEAVIGQWGLETGWGKSVIPGTNNLGNIKSTNGTGVAATDNQTGSRDRYRQYDSTDTFADDFTNLLSKGRYRNAVGTTDANAYFSGLKAGGYAEDPAYVQKGVDAANRVSGILGVSSKPAAVSQAVDPIDSIPDWKSIEQQPAFASFTPEEKQLAKEAYFDRYIAPVAGQDATSLRDRFLAPRERGAGQAITDTVRNLAAGALKIGPTAVKGVADLANMATGDKYDLGVSKRMQEGMDAIDSAIGTEEFNRQKAGFEYLMKDDSRGLGDMFTYMIDNPSILVDNSITTIGSMMLPAGAAKGVAVGAKALNLGQNAATKAALATSIGAAASQNAADTFSELKDQPIDKRYEGAAISAATSILASIATGGGAEGDIAKRLAGDLQAGRVGLESVKAFLKSTFREGVQESGEEIGNISGENVGGKPSTWLSDTKRTAFAGTLGGVMGGGAHLYTNAGEQSQVTPDGRIEPPVQEPAPTPAAAAAEPAPVDINPPATQPVEPAPQQTTAPEAFSDDDVTSFASDRYEQLITKRDGGWQTTLGENGPVEQQTEGAGLTPAEAMELDGLEKAGGRPDALRQLYGFDRANVPSDQSQFATQAQEPAPVEQPVEQPAPTQEFTNVTEPALQEAQNEESQRQAEESGLTPSEHAGDLAGQPGGTTAEQEPAAESTTAQGSSQASQPDQGLSASRAVEESEAEREARLEREAIQNEGNLAAEPDIADDGIPFNIGPSGTVAEPESDIMAQADSYVKGIRGPVFIDNKKGLTESKAKQIRNAGLTIAPSQHGGFYIATPQDAQAIADIEATKGKEEARAEILDYVQPKSEIDFTQPTNVVQATNADGDIVHEQVVNPEFQPQAEQQAQQIAQAAGGQVNVTTPADVIATRNEDTNNGQATPEIQATQAEQAQAQEPEAVVKPRTEKEAKAQKDYSSKWFGSQEKAQAFIDKQGVGDTHQVVADGKRYLINKKTNDQQATPAETQPVPSDTGTDTSGDVAPADTGAQRSEVSAADEAEVSQVDNLKQMRVDLINKVNDQGMVSNDRDIEKLRKVEAAIAEAEKNTQQKPSTNTIFTEDAAEKARALLRSKLGQLNAGIDPEIMQAGITLAGYHIEKGARSFAAYTKAMLEDMGDIVKPYLKSWYLGVKFDPRAAGFDGMDDAGVVEAADIDGLMAQADNKATKQESDNDTARHQETSERNQGERGNNQPDAGQANQKSVADASSENVGASEKGRNGRRSGTGRTSGNVGSRGKVRKGGDATDGREGASGTGVADDGAGRSGSVESQRGNYHIDDPEALIGGTPKVRFARNRKAIEAFQSITSEGRAPTQDELDAMASYIGWGSFGQELFQGTYDHPRPKDGWQAESDWLREHLGKDEWESAQRSIINAHYTDPITVGAMWDMVRQLGFTGGRVLEPSMGIGNFYGLMPKDLAERSTLAGIEMDSLTGGMAKILYPDANIQIKPYQDSKTADGFYDLVIGNWPFAKDGPADRRYMRLSPSLHDYFFLKALDQTRAGGLVVGITSAGTMDKKGTLTRAALAEKADLVAAFRLPSGAFEKYAGTSVVTDIIILKKRETPNTDVKASGWLNTAEVKTPSGQTITVNEYFAKNPDQVLGTLNFGSGTTYGRPAMIVDRPADLESRLREIANTLATGVYEPRTTKAKTIQYVTNNTVDREQSLTEQDGKLYQVQGEYLAPLADVLKYQVKDAQTTASREQQIRDLIGMRRAYGELIDAERDGAENAESKRKTLRDAYQAFVKAHGKLSDSYGLQALKKVDDPFYPSLAALETDGKPSAILERSTVRSKRRIDKPTVRDALVMARNESIDLSMDRVAELSGVPVEEAAAQLIEAGAIFKTPAGNYEVSDVYLSGNVRRKLREAQEAAEQGMDMTHNIEALKDVLPPDVPYFNIEAKLGAIWIRPEQYVEFISHLLGISPSDDIEVRWAINRWSVKFHDKALNHRPEATTTWGHQGVKFNNLLNAAMGNVAVTVRYRDSEGNVRVDEQATAEANEKAQKIRDEFANWLWSDPVRKIEMERTYNEVMNAIALPTYDGSFLSFEGMALQRGESPFNLRKHQVDAIWRGLANGRSMNAHEVGTGKTYTMGGLAVESRRYGLAKKPIIFAHNANSASVAREIGEMYPGAKLLYIDNLAPEKIGVTLRQIANDDWDAIVVPHSLIDRFALKKETLMEIAREEIEALEQEAIEAAQEDGSSLSVKDMDDPDALKKIRSATAKQLVHARNGIIKKIEDMSMRSSRENAVSFEDMGIDMVIVDEAHEFKKPPVATRMRMKGLNTASSAQSIALMFLTDYVKKLNNGRGVHLFTGTPITNTMTEIYNMMRYVMDDQMSRDGIRDWDAWFNTFADSTSDVELTATGDYEPVTRLASFVNVAELRRMIGQYMDIVFADDMPEFKPRETDSGKTLNSPDLTDKEREQLLNGRTENPIGRPYKKVVSDIAEMTEQQKEILAMLQQRANAFKNASKKARREMMLSGSPNSPVIVETDSANAGLDARLFDINAGDSPTSKVNRAVKRIMEHYAEHPLATQVVFVERGFTSESVSRKKDKTTGATTTVKKERFNLVKDMVEKLVSQGIPAKQIAIVDGSTSKEKRKAIADAMNRGEIRVVIGNTKTLGVGVNMQVNLRAMHHLDAPWMPGDLEQRNGRGHRQGNKWNTVLEYRYLTERIDGRRWQVLAVKDRFIKAFLKAKDDVRVIDGDAVSMDEEGDIGSTLADAAGDPRLMLMNKLRGDVAKLEAKERMHAQGVFDATQKVKSLANSIEFDQTRLAGLRKDDEAFREAVKGDLSITVGKQSFDNAEQANEALSKEVQKIDVGADVALGKAWGFEIRASWPARMLNVRYYIKSGDNHYDMGKPTVESARATLYAIKGKADSLAERIDDAKASIPRLQESTKAPFARAADLEKKRTMLTDIEADIQAHPIPAPAWLRNGAPVGSEAFVKGKAAVVEGHRWTNDGYKVTVSQGDKTRDVDYLDVTDENGLPVYEAQPFAPPVVAKPATDAPAMIRTESTGGMSQAEAQRTVDAIKATWSNGPTIVVVKGIDDSRIPAEVYAEYQAQKAGGATGTVSGVYHDEKIYVFANANANAAEVTRTVLHEALGHYGLRGVFGEQLDGVLRKVVELNRKAVVAKARQYGFDENNEADLLRAADEVLASLAESKPELNVVQRAVAIIRSLLRRIPGLKGMRLSNEELIRDYILPARGWVAGNPKQMAAQANDPQFSRKQTEQERLEIAEEFGDAVFTTFNAIHRSVGTQYHKAEISREFRKVFNLANKMESVGSLIAVRAAENAPDVLPKALDFMSAARQLIRGRKQAPELNKAINALLEGTTAGKSVLDGKVWTDDELRTKFALNDEGVSIYRQMRSTIDKLLDDVAAAETFALSSLYLSKSERDAVKEASIRDPFAGLSKLNIILTNKLESYRKKAEFIEQTGNLEMAASIQSAINDLSDTIQKVQATVNHARALKEAGYAPLMRFGKYTVTVQLRDPVTGELARDEATGELVPPLFFGRYETKAEADDAYFAQGAMFKGMGDQVSIEANTINESEFRMFEGTSPEVVSLFAAKVGNQAFEQMVYKNAVADQSLLKRRIHRKNIAGFSTEYDRVLASFVTSSGRWVSQKYYLNELTKSVKNIRNKDVQTEAQRVFNHVTGKHKKDTLASAVSSIAFMQYLGGITNVTSAFVNSLQVAQLMPQHLLKAYMTKGESAPKALAKANVQLAKAYKLAIGKQELPADLRTALKRASQENKVDAQELQHLYKVGIQGIQAYVTDQASRVPGVGKHLSKGLIDARYRLQAAGVLWGSMFGAVESLNRRVSFIAAWNAAKEMGVKDAYAFAAKAVDETQGIYTSANRQNWAQESVIGRSLLTFKMVPIMWLEIMARNLKYGGAPGRYAAALQLATLILLAGLAGMPFEDDILDIIDTIAQANDLNWNSKQDMEKWAKQVLGNTGGMIAMHGLSSVMPFDVSARLGMQDLMPSTGIFKKSNTEAEDYIREASQMLGVSGSLAKQAWDAGVEALAGRYGRAAMAAAPSSIGNLAAGAEIIATGKAKTKTGAVNQEASKLEGAGKAIGFNPSTLAEGGRERMAARQKTDVAARVQKEITDDMAQGAAFEDQAMIDKAQARIERWNARNPDYPIAVSASSVRQKAQRLLMDAETRAIKGTKRQWRGAVSQDLGLDTVE